ncbi:MAG: hypothetical protein KKG75_02060 [Nanoarchaeota archaeon]|nr:hypothetical protein [Nanoarchaeota archaeon]
MTINNYELARKLRMQYPGKQVARRVAHIIETANIDVGAYYLTHRKLPFNGCLPNGYNSTLIQLIENSEELEPEPKYLLRLAA